MDSKLELIIGPMFSGKSTELLRRIRMYQKIDNKVLVVKPSIDNRYNENKLTTHNFDSVECMVVDSLDEIDNHIHNYDILVIDEGQFFQNLKNKVIVWLKKNIIHIIIGGLDGDYKKEPIGDILELIPHSDACTKLTSLCMFCKDGTIAPFTLRLIESKDLVLVGGSESYMPVCRKHYIDRH